MTNVPQRFWLMPAPTRKFHLFTFQEGQSTARTFCSRHSHSAKRVLRDGRKEQPEHDLCRTCVKEHALAGTRLRGSR